MLLDITSYKHYVAKKQFWKVFGGKFRIYDPNGNMVLFADMKAFRLREDITVYTGEDKMTEVMKIQARQIIDLWAAYDVHSSDGRKIGAFRRKGLQSLLKDEWIIMDELDNEIGFIKEDRWLFAILRRFVTDLIPQNFLGTYRGMPVFEFKQNFNPFTLRLSLDFSPDTQDILDRRLGMAAAILLCAIESKQQS